MATSSSLKILLDLAQRRADAAAKELGRLNSHQQEAEKKLNLLLQYRQSYQAHFQAAMEQGADQVGWSNFTAFMNKLDAAVAEQRLAVSYAQKKREICAEEFLSCQRKLKSYDTLVLRQQAALDQKQIKHEQKLQDEFALNALLRSSFSAENDE